MDCLFCNIANGNVPANVVFENETLLAFHDIYPKAPHHLLIVPKRHIASINAVEAQDAALLGEMIVTAKMLAIAEGVDKTGYRLVFNTNADGGQTVSHIHLHLLAGRQMTWPPG